jgi:multiple antibiotic resistance protein
MESWPQALSYVFSTVVALLPIVNPFSTIGLVISITANLTEEERTQQIGRACIYMFFILVAVLVAGSLIMSFFGISIPGLRIAGGLVVSYLGFRMLFPGPPAITGGERSEAIKKQDVSFTPLAMPGLSGPGSIAVVVGLSSTLQEGGNVVIGHVLVAVGVAITAVISYFVLRAATRLKGSWGDRHRRVSRIMGFLLICIGVQFVINGVLEIAGGLQGGAAL